ncbi:pyridoxamine 5'-phosphate oxidase family protein [Cytobacillus praedii]|uniref:Pyridoxamine 5'-phosphate oxidase family protein n=1 Tax=Cytobacillus praedii TaxID=1742358 RepID=A0A4R1AQG3_9BACI|nr:pyridoxamine 5'-phosphate oxidase family protein [Cytobacillus praedii]TCJ02093.1 pyridoxamine 5'-phosphate oxidase family protein [Cytobacillus praedii]
MGDYQFLKKVNKEEELRSIIGLPGELIRRKVISYLDHNCADFISKSPFLVISTSDESGFCDVSPRGDNKGFVQVLNKMQLIMPKRPGNKRIDSLRNILSNPRVGLLFFIPGIGETLRVNGKAMIVTDDELLEKMSFKGKKPLLGIGIEVEECFIHCAKAFKRSNLWEPNSWEDKASLPSASKILLEHSKLPNESVESIQEDLDESYSKGLY